MPRRAQSGRADDLTKNKLQKRSFPQEDTVVHSNNFGSQECNGCQKSISHGDNLIKTNCSCRHGLLSVLFVPPVATLASEHQAKTQQSHQSNRCKLPVVMGNRPQRWEERREADQPRSATGPAMNQDSLGTKRRVSPRHP
jgi:hypothetical protein